MKARLDHCAWCGRWAMCAGDREGDPTCGTCLALPDVPRAVAACRGNVVELAARARTKGAPS